MARLIKRYGSRKLYDTSESRYVSLEEIAGWIRHGEEIQVIDNATSEDVSALTLTQVISEEGRKKSQFLSSDLLHDLIRAGGTAVSTRVKQIQDGVEGFVKKSLDRIVPVTQVRDEMNHLRDRLDELERALATAEERALEEARAKEKAKPKPRTRKATSTTAGKSTGSKSTGTTTRKSTGTTTRRRTTKKTAETAK